MKDKNYNEYRGLEMRHLVGMSGGKDSLATTLHAIERDIDFTSFFTDTGNEHEITYEYLDYLETKLGIKIQRVHNEVSENQWEKRRRYIRNNWGKEGIARNGQYRRGLSEGEIEEIVDLIAPTGNYFLDHLLLHGIMPTSSRKFCSIELKQMPIRDQIVTPLTDEGVTVVSWLGVRAQESSARKYACVVDVEEYDEEENPIIVVYRPIVTWTHEDVFAIAKRHGIKPNPLYTMGMARVGCFPCINSGKNEIKEIATRFPEVIDRLRKWEKIVSKVNRMHVCQKRDYPVSFFTRQDENGKAMGIDDVVAWSKTTWGGKQYDMMGELTQQDLTQCSAIYPVVCE